MKSVLITGRTGFIGNAVAARLSEFPDDFAPALISVRDNAWREKGFAGCDAVLHAAGIAHVRPDPSLEGEYARVNRDLAIEVAKRAKADGVRHFVFLSSIIVYGDASRAGGEKLIGPDTPATPSGAYGRSKLEAEEGILALQDEAFTVSILRLPMVYGRGCRGNYNALARLARKMPVFPDFPNRRSVLYVGNLAECVRLILKDRLGGMFFPQDARVISTSELAERVARCHGRKIRFLKWLNLPVRLLGGSGIVRRAFGDMAYAPAMSEMPGDYRIFDPDTAVRITEIR